MPRSRFALATGALPLDTVRDAARDAERLGYEAVLVGEAGIGSDAFVAAAAVLLATSEVRCGPGIANVHDRHPVVLARAAATLDRLSPGRALLGVGRSSREWVEDKLGLPWSLSGDAVADAVRICTELLAGRDVEHQGRRWSAHLGGLGESWRPRQTVPVLLAAVGPRTLRLAGALADGVLLNYGAPLEYVRWAVEEVRAGAAGADRVPESVDVYGYLFVVRTDAPDAERRMATLRRELERLHAEPGQGRWLAGQVGEPQQWDDEALRRFAVVGTRDECLRRIEEYREAGLRCPVLMPSAMRALHG
jgi:alkanesulfonate monooxygenase SsuD/methylene tetrahydromethanopterin reductase-like flavin-dependent oxidoreductase (luciferase family)